MYLAEIIAIREALSWLKDNGDCNRITRLYSDSLSAVNKLNGFTAEEYQTFETMELMRDLSKSFSLTINWVKGHSDQTGNEYVDTLARKGAKEATKIQTTYPHFPLTYREIKQLIHSNYLSQWQVWWETLDETKYHISRLFVPQVVENQIASKMNQKDLMNLVQIITGHGLFKRHLRHWNDIHDTSCDLCGEAVEDPWHLWNLCPAPNGHRARIQKEIDRGLLWQKGLIKFKGK